MPANNFTVLRLLLATFVIVSHSPEVLSGNHASEPLIALGSCMTIGELAVAGFFAISGMLIVQSWNRSPRLISYMAKRMLRIYPAFVLASLFCIVVVGPLATHSSYFASLNPSRLIFSTLYLEEPELPELFSGRPYQNVNGPMWTIAYEFRCYLLVAALGVAGLSCRWFWLFILVTSCILVLTPSFDSAYFSRTYRFVGRPYQFVLLLIPFCSGACICFFQPRVRAIWTLIAIVGVVCGLACCDKPIAYIVAGVLLSYIFYCLAYLYIVKVRIPDVSYGVYLYAWPIQQLIANEYPAINPLLLTFSTIPITFAFGAISWYGLEQRFLRWKPSGIDPVTIESGQATVAASQ